MVYLIFPNAILFGFLLLTFLLRAGLFVLHLPARSMRLGPALVYFAFIIFTVVTSNLSRSIAESIIIEHEYFVAFIICLSLGYIMNFGVLSQTVFNYRKMSKVAADEIGEKMARASVRALVITLFLFPLLFLCPALLSAVIDIKRFANNLVEVSGFFAIYLLPGISLFYIFFLCIFAFFSIRFAVRMASEGLGKLRELIGVKP